MIRRSYRRTRRERAKELGRIRGLASARVMAARRMQREPDADTCLWRARQDARGQVVREGRTYTATGVTHWQIVRSQVGQHRQLDVLVNGQVWRTGGTRKVARWLKVARRQLSPPVANSDLTHDRPTTGD